MPKLRRMLGDIYSPECTALMRLIETQSKETLGKWALGYATENYLPIYEAAFPEDRRLREAAELCGKFFVGEAKLAEIKPALKAARETAARTEAEPARAAAKAVATAFAAVQTPTNAFGFLLYGAAAAAYSAAGLLESPEIYDELGTKELRRALSSLEAAAVKNEKNPAKINWNC